MNFAFYLREAMSDVSGMKVLGPAPNTVSPVELDYPLAANAALAQIDAFITPASLPSVLAWNSGAYALYLEIVNAAGVSFTVELWRADLNGNDLEILGSRPALQTASGAAPTNAIQASFSITDVGSSLNKTDRLKLKLFAENFANVNTEFSVLCSVSGVQTQIPIPTQLTNQFNTRRRGRFLGFVARPGEGFDYFNAQGVNLYPNPF